jgi:hypothetical protein
VDEAELAALDLGRAWEALEFFQKETLERLASLVDYQAIRIIHLTCQ